MKLKLKENPEALHNLQKAVSQLKNTHVEIGLPPTASSRNRFLLVLHEHGSPLMNIPPRPVIQPALSSPEARSAISGHLLEACEAAASNSPEDIPKAFEKAGEAGVNAIHAYIDAGVPPPNAPVTVHGGWVFNRAANKPVKVEGKGFNKPLVETGELYNAFDWEIKDRND